MHSFHPMHKLWYEYLNRAIDLGDELTWKPSVKEDFGFSHYFSFEEWWDAFGYLFERVEVDAIEVFKKRSDIDSWESELDDEVFFIGVIHLWKPRNEIIAALDDLLEKRGLKQARGKPIYEPMPAHTYDLESRDHVEKIQKYLDVYDLKYSGMTLKEIGLQLLPEDEKDDPLEDELIKNAWRMKDKADQLVRNVAMGRFPKYDN